MGGLSSERAVSLSTGMMILESLNREKYDAMPIDAALFSGSGQRRLAVSSVEVAAITEAERKLAAIGPLRPVSDMTSSDGRVHVAFIALHGRYGEDGTVQGMLELLGIPYTGSGVLASALAMDKIVSKRLLRQVGVPMPESVDIVRRSEMRSRDIPAEVRDLGYPVMVKPNRQGSTIGMTKVKLEGELQAAIEEAFKYDSQILIEKFVAGTEITVGLLGNSNPQALPIVEIVPSKGFYDYEAKYTPGATEEIVPARISERAASRAGYLAVSVHDILGCRGMSRVDMIVRPDDEVVVLEINTIPGMTQTSLLPTAAKAAGIEFPELLDRLIELALEEE
ncbi:MAG: D-alanine--D-alanine ligase [Armatimonadetes bacterium]|nr:D-alanine--D-alanine ligase [Armatimonadota bacterium]